jgi:outer membrane protein assembly factor BamB
MCKAKFIRYLGFCFSLWVMSLGLQLEGRELSTGWNLVSIALDAPVSVSSYLETHLEGRIRKIWSYDEGWKGYDPSKSTERQELRLFEPGKGYWFLVASPGARLQLDLDSDKSQPLSFSSRGWSLGNFNQSFPIGLRTDLVQPENFSSPYGPQNLKKIWGFVQGQWISYSNSEHGGNLEELLPGYAYWFFLRDSSVGTLSKDLPLVMTPSGKQNSEAILIFTGDTTLLTPIPPLFSNPSPSRTRSSVSRSSVTGSRIASQTPLGCNGEEDETKVIGQAMVYSLDGRQMNQVAKSEVTCGATGDGFARYEVGFSKADLAAVLALNGREPALVITVVLDSGPAQKRVVPVNFLRELPDLNSVGDPVVIKNLDTSSASTLSVEMLAMDMGRRLGLPLGMLALGETQDGLSDSPTEITDFQALLESEMDPEGLSSQITLAATNPQSSFFSLTQAITRANGALDRVEEELYADRREEIHRLITRDPGDIEDLELRDSLQSATEMSKTVSELLLKMREALRQGFLNDEEGLKRLSDLIRNLLGSTSSDSDLVDLSFMVAKTLGILGCTKGDEWLSEVINKKLGRLLEWSKDVRFLEEGDQDWLKEAINYPKDALEEIIRDEGALEDMAEMIGRGASVVTPGNPDSRFNPLWSELLKKILAGSTDRDSFSTALSAAICASRQDDGIFLREVLRFRGEIKSTTGWDLNWRSIVYGCKGKSPNLKEKIKDLIREVEDPSEVVEIIEEAMDALDREDLNDILEDSDLDVGFPLERMIYANAGADRKIQFREAGIISVVLDAGGSLDPLGHDLSYRWVEVTGDVVRPLEKNLARIQIDLNVLDPGLLRFQVEVWDTANPQRQAEDQISLNFWQTSPPIIVLPRFFTVTLADTGMQTLELDGSESYDPNNNEALKFLWDIKKQTGLAVLSSETDSQMQLRFTQPGNFLGKLQVESANGRQRVQEFTMRVLETGRDDEGPSWTDEIPEIAFHADAGGNRVIRLGDRPVEVTLDGSKSRFTGDGVQYLWSGPTALSPANNSPIVNFRLNRADFAAPARLEFTLKLSQDGKLSQDMAVLNVIPFGRPRLKVTKSPNRARYSGGETIRLSMDTSALAPRAAYRWESLNSLNFTSGPRGRFIDVIAPQVESRTFIRFRIHGIAGKVAGLVKVIGLEVRPLVLLSAKVLPTLITVTDEQNKQSLARCTTPGRTSLSGLKFQWFYDSTQLVLKPLRTPEVEVSLWAVPGSVFDETRLSCKVSDSNGKIARSEVSVVFKTSPVEIPTAPAPPLASVTPLAEIRVGRVVSPSGRVLTPDSNLSRIVDSFATDHVQVRINSQVSKLSDLELIHHWSARWLLSPGETSAPGKIFLNGQGSPDLEFRLPLIESYRELEIRLVVENPESGLQSPPDQVVFNLKKDLDLAPIAHAGDDLIYVLHGSEQGKNVYLDGSGSLSPSGNPLEYRWTYGGDDLEIITITTTSAFNLVRESVFLPVGEHGFELRVMDKISGLESQADPVLIQIENQTQNFDFQVDGSLRLSSEDILVGETLVIDTQAFVVATDLNTEFNNTAPKITEPKNLRQTLSLRTESGTIVGLSDASGAKIRLETDVLPQGSFKLEMRAWYDENQDGVWTVDDRSSLFKKTSFLEVRPKFKIFRAAIENLPSTILRIQNSLDLISGIALKAKHENPGEFKYHFSYRIYARSQGISVLPFMPVPILEAEVSSDEPSYEISIQDLEEGNYFLELEVIASQGAYQLNDSLIQGFRVMAISPSLKLSIVDPSQELDWDQFKLEVFGITPLSEDPEEHRIALQDDELLPRLASTRSWVLDPLVPEVRQDSQVLPIIGLFIKATSPSSVFTQYVMDLPKAGEILVEMVHRKGDIQGQYLPRGSGFSFKHGKLESSQDVGEHKTDQDLDFLVGLERGNCTSVFVFPPPPCPPVVTLIPGSGRRVLRIEPRLNGSLIPSEEFYQKAFLRSSSISFAQSLFSQAESGRMIPEPGGLYIFENRSAVGTTYHLMHVTFLDPYGFGFEFAKSVQTLPEISFYRSVSQNQIRFNLNAVTGEFWSAGGMPGTELVLMTSADAPYYGGQPPEVVEVRDDFFSNQEWSAAQFDSQGELCSKLGFLEEFNPDSSQAIRIIGYSYVNTQGRKLFYELPSPLRFFYSTLGKSSTPVEGLGEFSILSSRVTRADRFVLNYAGDTGTSPVLDLNQFSLRYSAVLSVGIFENLSPATSLVLEVVHKADQKSLEFRLKSDLFANGQGFLGLELSQDLLPDSGAIFSGRRHVVTPVIIFTGQSMGGLLRVPNMNTTWQEVYSDDSGFQSEPYLKSATEEAGLRFFDYTISNSQEFTVFDTLNAWRYHGEGGRDVNGNRIYYLKPQRDLDEPMDSSSSFHNILAQGAKIGDEYQSSYRVSSFIERDFLQDRGHLDLRNRREVKTRVLKLLPSYSQNGINYENVVEIEIKARDYVPLYDGSDQFIGFNQFPLSLTTERLWIADKLGIIKKTHASSFLGEKQEGEAFLGFTREVIGYYEGQSGECKEAKGAFLGSAKFCPEKGDITLDLSLDIPEIGDYRSYELQVWRFSEDGNFELDSVLTERLRTEDVWDRHRRKRIMTLKPEETGTFIFKVFQLSSGGQISLDNLDQSGTLVGESLVEMDPSKSLWQLLISIALAPISQERAVEPELLWRTEVGVVLDSCPAIAEDGTLYVGSRDKHLYALKPDGSILWSYETGHRIQSSPVIGPDGTIYIGSMDRRLHAVHPDGSRKWMFETGNYVHSAPAIAEDGTLYFGAYDHYVYALSPDGTVKWKFLTGHHVHAAPVIGDDGTVYVGSLDHYLYALSANGELKWKFETGNGIFASAAIASDGTLYIGSYDKSLYALSTTGEELWSFTTGLYIYASPIIGPEGTVYLASRDHFVYALNPEGDLKWSFKTDGIINATPVLDRSGVLYLGSLDQNFYAIRAVDGTRVFRYATGHWVHASATISEQGVLYFGSMDGWFYALKGGLGTGVAQSWSKFQGGVSNRGLVENRNWEQEE